jgi:hypothetical protein
MDAAAGAGAGAGAVVAGSPLQLGPDTPEVLIRRAGLATGAPPACGRAFLALLALHGDEPCGVTAANRLLASGYFQSAAAAPDCPFDELRLVVGNPRALRAGVRLIDLNLNRAFTRETLAAGRAAAAAAQGAAGARAAGAGATAAEAAGVAYEALRAAQLAPLVEGAGALLDIHSTSCATPPFAFYVPGDGPSYSAARAAAAGGSSSGGDAAQGAARSGGGGGGGGGGGSCACAVGERPAGAPPPEAALALSLPVDYVIRDYTGADQGLAIEWAAAAGCPAATTVECGSHADPAAALVAEGCLRAFARGAWLLRSESSGGGGSGGAGAAAAAAPRPQRALRHVVAREGVLVRPGFHWLGGAPPAAFSFVEQGAAVARDEAGDVTCPCPGGGLVFMPAGRPRLGEDAMLWCHDA